jgi:hypothetical protein
MTSAAPYLEDAHETPYTMAAMPALDIITAFRCSLVNRIELAALKYLSDSSRLMILKTYDQSGLSILDNSFDRRR